MPRELNASALDDRELSILAENLQTHPDALDLKKLGPKMPRRVARKQKNQLVDLYRELRRPTFGVPIENRDEVSP